MRPRQWGDRIKRKKPNNIVLITFIRPNRQEENAWKRFIVKLIYDFCISKVKANELSFTLIIFRAIIFETDVRLNEERLRNFQMHRPIILARRKRVFFFILIRWKRDIPWKFTRNKPSHSWKLNFRRIYLRVRKNYLDNCFPRSFCRSMNILNLNFTFTECCKMAFHQLHLSAVIN